MPNITEFYQDRSGNVTIEKDNGTVLNYNVSDVVTVQRDGSGNVTGLIADGQVVSSGGGAGITDGDKGDIVVSGAGSTFTIDNEVVSNSKLATAAQSTIKGRAAGSGTGTPVDLTPAQARTILNVADGATANTGTVTNVSMSVPTGLTVAGSPVTTSGSLDVTLTAGYSIPTTTKQTEWDNKAAASHAHTIANVTGLETSLADKLSASTAVPVTSKSTAIVALDRFLITNSENSGIPAEVSPAQVAESVLSNTSSVTNVKARLANLDKIPAFDNSTADSPFISKMSQLKSYIRQAWAIPGTYVIGGDSRGAQGFVDATISVGTYAGQHTTRNSTMWALASLGVNLRLTQTAAVGGDTIAMFVARQRNTGGGSLFGAQANPGWAAYRPEFLFLDLGINDILNQSTITLETSLTGARAILNLAQEIGTTVVWPNEYPEGPLGTVLSAAQETRRLDWNNALKALEVEYPCLWVPDASLAMRNPATGKLYPGLVSDTSGTHVHLNNAGAKARGEAIGIYISPLFTNRQSSFLCHGATELITLNPACNQYQLNPNLATGATVADVLQSAVSFGAGATGTATLITDPEGFGQAIQVDVTYTGTSSAYALLGFKSSQSAFVGGECIIAAARVRCGLPGGSVGTLSPGILPEHMVRCPESTLLVTDAVADGGIANVRASFANNVNDAGVTGEMSYIVSTPDYQLKNGAPQLVQNQLWLRGIGVGSGAVRWIVSRPVIRSVPRRSNLVPFGS